MQSDLNSGRLTERPQLGAPPQNLKSLSGSELLRSMTNIIKVETASTLGVIRHFQEMSRRKLYLEKGYPNLFEMATKYFGYSAGSAQRRIASMRLVSDLPELESKIETGKLNLTTAATVQSFLYAEKKDNKGYSKEEKLELIQFCQGKSSREVERELAKRSPTFLERDSVRALGESRVRISVTISDELQVKLERLKALMSHKNPSMSTEVLLDYMADLALEKLDPCVAKKPKERKTKEQKSEKKKVKEQGIGKQKSKRQESEKQETMRSDEQSSEDETANKNDAALRSAREVNEKSKTENEGKIAKEEAAKKTSEEAEESFGQSVRKRSRHITIKVRREVLSQNQNRGCEYVDPETGKRCGSHNFLEPDHIIPFSHGGVSTVENLRLLCANHNKWVYRKIAQDQASFHW